MHAMRLRRLVYIIAVGAVIVTTASWRNVQLHGQAIDPNYQTRRSSCEGPRFDGKSLSLQATQNEIETNPVTGLEGAGVSERSAHTLSGSTSPLDVKGGEIYVCSEYGRVVIEESSDGRMHVLVRVDVQDRGGPQAIRETKVEARMTSLQGRLQVAVWHSTLGFTERQQPAWVNILVRVPPSGAYRVSGVANHGAITIRNLDIAGGGIHALTGYKVKGRKGYVGGHRLENVGLVGDFEISTGDASVTGFLRVVSSAKVQVRAGRGDIALQFRPDAEVGYEVKASTGNGAVGVDLDLAQAQKGAYAPSSFSGATPDLLTKRRRVTLDLSAEAGNIDVTNLW
jgi:hypothetical protein